MVAEYSTAQWIISIWTSRFSSCLSILGSSLIIYMIVFQKNRIRLLQMQNRLILGMSIMDMLNSSSLLVSTAASPKELSSHIYGAKGNHVTCTIQSVFMTMGFSVPCYNAFLSLYYMGVIKYNMSDDALAKYELPAHLISILYPLIVCIFAVSVDLYHPRINLGCSWYGDKCAFAQPEDNCIPIPQLYHILFQTVMGILTGLALLVIIYSMVSIYLFVRDQTLAMSKYTSFRNRNSLISSTGVTGTAVAAGNGRVVDAGETSEQPQQYPRRRGVQDETYVQSMLYIAAYILTFIAPLLNNWFGTYFAAQFFQRLLYPLQGFWNFITFIRPRFVLVREKNLYDSFAWVFKVTVFGMSAKEEEERKQIKANRKKNSKGGPLSNKMMEKKKKDRLAMLERARPTTNMNQDGGGDVSYGRLDEQDGVIVHEERTKHAITNEDEFLHPSLSSSSRNEEEAEEVQNSRSALFSAAPISPNNTKEEVMESSYPTMQEDNSHTIQDPFTLEENVMNTSPLSTSSPETETTNNPYEMQQFTTFTSLVAQDFLDSTQQQRGRRQQSTKKKSIHLKRRSSISSWMYKSSFPSNATRRSSLPTMHLDPPPTMSQTTSDRMIEMTSSPSAALSSTTRGVSTSGNTNTGMEERLEGRDLYGLNGGGGGEQHQQHDVSRSHYFQDNRMEVLTEVTDEAITTRDEEQ